MAATAAHVAACAACQQLFQESLKKAKGNRPISISLSAENWFRSEHLDYDELEALVEDRLDDEDKQIVNLHLETCADCREQARSLLEFIESPEYGLSMRYTIEERRSWSEKLIAWWNQSADRWKLAYTGAALVIITLTILAAVLFSRSDLRDKRDQVAESPSPSIPTTPSPVDSSEDKIALLKDGERIIRFSESGILSGLETFPSEIQQPISEALLAGTLKKPAVLSDLASGRGALKGSPAANSPFKLLSPGRTVITEDRPVFRWTPLDGASSYQVQVGDLNGTEAANSGQLSSSLTQWTPAKPLKRGIVYMWIVTATVNGEEITAPASSEAEMRFRVLGKKEMSELATLKRQVQSHLALGIFYAREGMVAEAERELQLLAKDNPDSPIISKLLRSLRSWR